MKIVCSPSEAYLKTRTDADLGVLLFGLPGSKNLASCGGSIKKYFEKRRLLLEHPTWDLLSFALSVVAADLAATRRTSPDGWTRHIELEIAVNEPAKWQPRQELVQSLLRFLSTDIWTVRFLPNGFSCPVAKPNPKLEGSCVTLISGGLDSFIGAIDLVAKGEFPLFVSQIVHGDKIKQSDFVNALGKTFDHIQINHSFKSPDALESSQRARSIIFFAYGIVASTLLKGYGSNGGVALYVCENGLISLNPPLTEARIGSLSTRTTHPYFLKLLKELIQSLGFKVRIETPYQLKTKGEMLNGCLNQPLLRRYARSTTSCGRFTRNGFQHCGRCVPCLIRRASFVAWQKSDTTKYVYKNLRINDAQHAGFDDVRSSCLAIQSIKETGFANWFGSSNALLPPSDAKSLRAVAERGMQELADLLAKYRLC